MQILYFFKNRISCTGKNNFTIVLLITLLTISACVNAFSFDFQDQPFRTRLSIICTQIPGDQVEVSALLRARIEGVYIGLADAELEVYSIGDSANILLDKLVTDSKGNIALTVNTQTLAIDEDGYRGILITFNGDVKHNSSEKDVLFKTASLIMNAEVIDSVKTITIFLTEIGEESIPIEEVEVMLEVSRMFSDLPIISESTDEEGKVEIIFPNDIPGNENGELEIIAKVDDSDDYGSFKNRIKIDWGVPLRVVDQTNKRALWSQNAPLWMVWTFGLLMTLVWGHFMIILYKLYLIRKEGQNN